MADRLAEIEGVQDALHDIPDDISVPVSAGLARDLLAVATAAGLLDPDYTLRCLLPRRTPLRNGVFRNDDCGECGPCALRAALANLEGGAT